ncbi:hypothetical protein P3342_005552 [Pyrenophora teres f. teres]|uniref:J domain-containing protein n=2 Tax=Pyrenophora teres f. teres TaxID=97479 RepID=E3RDC7_PYRTT|nr:hypothetical protein PTT_01988 [Pyrenophora teres f. teres 0-1]KAE8845966.1 hypothetical protein HRS9139_00533 [Pyrenophora teres f. teres]KAE8848105.1 hypothetical protein PTNB85_01948 [Pyrenophora teres f. teres]KAE8853732.1 hypothetical protein HRS9122_00724 [Pyrenophora teres f. teres]KAE8868030.1 hypothetical protein PTNB29_01941 [Pyrenophora teres f. teres]
MPYPVYDGGPSDPFANIKAMLNELPGVAEGSRFSTHMSPPQHATEERIPSHLRETSSSYSYSNGTSSSHSSRSSSQYRTEKRMPRGERSHHRTEERVPHGERSHHRTEERGREQAHPQEGYTQAEFRDSQGNWYYEYTHTYHSFSGSSQPPPQPRRTHTARPRTPSYSSSSYTSSSSSSSSQDEYYPRPRPHSPPPSSSARDNYYTYPHPRARSPPPPPPQGTKPRNDLYDVLGISRSATAAEIKKAHRAMSLKWHPDRCGEGMKDRFTEIMAEINQANDVLGDEGKWAYYDKTGLMASDS